MFLQSCFANTKRLAYSLTDIMSMPFVVVRESMGAVSMGGKGTYRVPYTPMVQQVQHVEYGNAEDMRKAIRNLHAVGEKVAAVILEPIQGEAGVIIPPKGYLQEVRKICDEYGVALIFEHLAAASCPSQVLSVNRKCGHRI